MQKKLRTAESVTPKHPDKMCDQISDAILDECLRQDPNSRVAVEVMGGHNLVTVMGELTTTRADVDISKIVERITGNKNIDIRVNIVSQSLEIAQGVDTGGAGDQGIMIGYACNETLQYMPMEVMMARRLCQYIYETFPTDGKTQVTVLGDKVIAVVASFQNAPKQQLEDLVRTWLHHNTIKYTDYPGPEIFCNPAGDWNIGGFDADTGLTGRKIAVDSYGPRVPIGGGAFSGKDGTKVDRSGAYMARKLAVDYLLSHNVTECQVELAYAIGKAEPVQATVTAQSPEAGEHTELLNLDLLTPRSIIKSLKLTKPIFEKTAQWGHFGNGFAWDK